MSSTVDKKALGRGLGKLRGLEALTSAMSRPVPLSSPSQNQPSVDSTNTNLAQDISTPSETKSKTSPPINQNNSTDTTSVGVISNAAQSEVTHKTDEDYQINYIDIDQIKPNPFQPRRHFSPDELEDLIESIEKVGVLQPIVVRPMEGGFEIVAGERRWRAAQDAGLTKMPVIVRELPDKEAFQLAIIENVQRQQLNPVEEARSYQRLIEEFKMTQEEISSVVGKKRASIANFLRLLNLDQDVISHIESSQLSMGHAKVILSVRDKAAQKRIAKRIISEGLSVRAIEKIIPSMVVLDSGRAVKHGLESSKEEKRNSNIATEIVDKLRSHLGTRVTVQPSEGKKGKIVVEYFSDQDLDRIVELICTNRPTFDF
jgi:ParB family chromosome partitioning protein